MSIQLAERFENIENFKKATMSEITGLYGIGDTVAENIINWFQDKNKKQILDNLLKEIEIIKVVKKEQKFKDIKIVVTGRIDGYARDEIKQILRNYGASVSESVSKNTDYVFAGADAGSKLDKAKKLGVKILKNEEIKTFLSK